MSARHRLGRFEECHHRVLHDGPEQVVLGGEIEVDRTLGHASAGGHLFQRRLSEATLAKDGECGGEQLVGARLRPAEEAWGMGGGSGHGGSVSYLLVSNIYPGEPRSSGGATRDDGRISPCVAPPRLSSLVSRLSIH